MISKQSIVTIIAIIGAIYLFISLNPFVLWIIWPGFINFPLFIGVIIIGLLAIYLKWYSLTINKILFIIPITFFMLHLGTTFLGGPEFNIGKIMSFTSLIIILGFQSFLHLKIFELFRKGMLFLSWFAVIIFIITLVGIELPYYYIPGDTLVMQNSFGGQSFYKLYGLVVSSTNTVYNLGGFNVARICGPFQEPGHFAIYIGLILLFQKMTYNRLSKGFIIAGVLTFSPNFFLILFIIFFYDFLYSQNRRNIVKYVFIGSFFVFFLLLFSEDIRDQIYDLVIGRNIDETGIDIEKILDDRAGKQTLAYYHSFVQTNYFLYGKGVDFMSQYGILSDYRGMILKYGLLGFIFSIFACVRVLFFSKDLRVISLIAIVILIIYLQRAWMFESTFVYLFIIIGLSASKLYKNQIKSETDEDKS